MGILKESRRGFSGLNKDLTGQDSGVVNVHRFNTNNVGDLASAPYLYFPKLGTDTLDIIDFKENTDYDQWLDELAGAHVVVGGGGFLERKAFKKSMKTFFTMSKQGKKIVYWGLGHNNAKFKKKTMYKSGYGKDFEKIDLFGTRDHDTYHWVPCASCMSDNLDQQQTTKREFGIVMHHGIPFDNPENHAVINNDISFKDTTKFIGESEYVLTNSYHALYWSILMKKKVIAIPSSSKMYGLKFKVPVCDIKDVKSHINKVKVHNEALDLCREQNTHFAERAYDYLKL